MATYTQAGASPEVVAFPPVVLAGELQHVFCNAGDVDEFLASAHAWLSLFVLAQDSSLTEEQVWERVQAAHDQGLLLAADEDWRAELEDRLSTSLLKVPVFAQLWQSLSPREVAQRVIH